MEIQKRISGSLGTLDLVGRFIFDDHQPFKVAITRLMEQEGASQIDLNLAGLSYLDSSALGALLLMHERAAAVGVKITMSNPTPSVLKILKVVNLDRVFEIAGYGS